MRILTITCILFLISSFSFNKENPWTSIFNGENLEGWTVKCVNADKSKSYWSVTDGYIEVNSMGDKDHDYVWLMTDEEYKDFSLKLKFAAFKSSTGNSGIQIRSRYDEEDEWLDGPQIDVHPNGPWRSGYIYDETRDMKRWIYPDIPKGKWVNESMREEVPPMYFSDETLKWNELEITVDGWKIVAFLNGTQITDFNNKDLLTGPGHKKYNVGKKGHICLQLHSKDELKMLYKDIQIKKL